MSEDGSEGSWKKVEARETIAETDASTNVRLYTYDFEPVTAVFVRMNIVNSTATDTGSNKPCTMITEVELIKATTSYPVVAEAALKSLNVNGKDLSASALASGSYDTRAIMAEVAAAGKDNAAVTILPAYENQIRSCSSPRTTPRPVSLSSTLAPLYGRRTLGPMMMRATTPLGT